MSLNIELLVPGLIAGPLFHLLSDRASPMQSNLNTSACAIAVSWVEIDAARLRSNIEVLQDLIRTAGARYSVIGTICMDMRRVEVTVD